MASIGTAIENADSQELWNYADLQPLWYAAYTSAHHEKSAAAEISLRGIESFLPVYRAARRWSDRRVELELPLFPGYVFVRLALSNRLKVLQVPGVARLVGFGGSPAVLPVEQIDALRAGLNHRIGAQPHPYLTVGRKVRLKSGPLAGAEGILLRRKGKFRVVISIELIQRAVAVDVDTSDVEIHR